MIYNLFLYLYRTGIQIVSYWNPKARLWVQGRKDIFKKIRSIPVPEGEIRIWMHCASLGEFEQGRPLIEALKKAFPRVVIILTFFSPSGYEIRKNYKGADFIFYLPIDSPGNARVLLDAVRPALVLWIKYDYWYHYLKEVKKRNIPLLLISGIFWKEQLFFKSYGTFYRRMLQCFTHLFVQTAGSKQLLESIGFNENVSINGDTRFDRVIEIAEQFEPLNLIKAFCKDFPVVVAGSTWQEDEEELFHFASTHPEIKFIIAPHEISAAHVREIKKLFRHSVTYSDFEAASSGTVSHPGTDAENTPHIMIIDNIGMLARLYSYATITYVGGGFGKDGLHNVLEAAVYGKPVVFGPEYEKFIEAVELVEAGGAFSVGTALELETVFTTLLENPVDYNQACEASKQYVYSKKGAKDRIINYILENNFIKTT